MQKLFLEIFDDKYDGKLFEKFGKHNIIKK